MRPRKVAADDRERGTVKPQAFKGQSFSAFVQKAHHDFFAVKNRNRGYAKRYVVLVRLEWYCDRAASMDGFVAKNGLITNPVFFFTNSRVCKSSGSVMARSSSSPSLRNATTWWRLAIGSGIIFKTSWGIF